MAAQRKRKTTTGDLVKLAAVGVVIVATGVSYFMHVDGQKKEAAAIAQMWTVTGPACPTPAPGAVVTEPAKALEYMDGLKIARESGPINCNTIKAGGTGPETPVCMLLGPRNTRVTTAKGVFDFTPPAGENISIYVRDGVPSCVMNINRAVTQ